MVRKPKGKRRIRKKKEKKKGYSTLNDRDTIGRK